MPVFRAAVAALSFLLAVAAAASADPITVTSGTFRLSGFAQQEFNSVRFSLAGDQGFTATGVQSDGAFQRFPTACAIEACASGTTTSAQQALGFLDAFGSATIAGTIYPQTLASAFDFVFTSGRVAIPVSSESVLALQSPFTFRGTLNLDTVTDARVPVASLALTGAGTATTNLQRVGDRYAVTSFTYEFAEASPTPEPGSLLLLASGGLLLMRRMRRTRTMPECHASDR